MFRGDAFYEREVVELLPQLLGCDGIEDYLPVEGVDSSVQHGTEFAEEIEYFATEPIGEPRDETVKEIRRAVGKFSGRVEFLEPDEQGEKAEGELTVYELSEKQATVGRFTYRMFEETNTIQLKQWHSRHSVEKSWSGGLFDQLSKVGLRWEYSHLRISSALAWKDQRCYVRGAINGFKFSVIIKPYEEQQKQGEGIGLELAISNSLFDEFTNLLSKPQIKQGVNKAEKRFKLKDITADSFGACHPSEQIKIFDSLSLSYRMTMIHLLKQRHQLTIDPSTGLFMLYRPRLYFSNITALLELASKAQHPSKATKSLTRRIIECPSVEQSIQLYDKHCRVSLSPPSSKGSEEMSSSEADLMFYMRQYG